MEKYKFFLLDLVTILKEKIVDSRNSKKLDDFNKGIAMGRYEALDLIKSQAKAFDISLEEIGLDNFEIEQFFDKRTR
jgi:hypothetical protein